MQLHIAVAIPTFNRLSYLKKNVSSILNQKLSANITLSIVIANSASSDGTSEFLDLLIHKQPGVYCYNQMASGETQNLKFLSETIPTDVDWVWLLGDDDSLASEHSVEKIAEVIFKHPSNDLSFIHACQARRSQNTGQVVSLPLEHLCSELGYHEMLGWYSSLIVKRDIFCRSMIDTHNKINAREGPTNEIGARWSAYTHSRYLFERLQGKIGAFIDLPLVEPQDKAQTKSTQLRWNKLQIGERFLFVVDDLISLKDQGLLPERNSTSFFRLVTYSWWDRYFVRLFGELGDQSIPYEEKSGDNNVLRLESHWKRLQLMAEMVDDKEVSKALKIRVTHGVELADLYFRTKGESKFVLESIARHFKMANASTYPFLLMNK
jgi:glycosyltransferase involved in cell wall biosynthesis